MGKHIIATCTIAGVAFNPANVLIYDTQSLIDRIVVSTAPNPIIGLVVDSTGTGVSGATVSIMDSNGNTVATASTDITGFYYFASTSSLTSGSSYTAKVTGLPSGFTTPSPSSQTFVWSGHSLL